MWGWGTEYKHTWVHTSIQPHFLTCNFRSHQLSRVYFRMLQMVLDWCAYTWQIVSELVCVCDCVWILCVSVCVCKRMGICIWAFVELHTPQLYKNVTQTPLSAVLRVINHAAILIYVPLLVALPFILGKRISPLHRFGKPWFLFVTCILLLNPLWTERGLWNDAKTCSLMSKFKGSLF